jgi:hypothetical protein
LGDDVRAIAVSLDHFLQATDLPFDAASFRPGSTPMALRPRGLVSQAQFAAKECRFSSSAFRTVFFAVASMIPSTPMYTPSPYMMSSGSGSDGGRVCRGLL